MCVSAYASCRQKDAVAISARQYRPIVGRAQEILDSLQSLPGPGGHVVAAGLEVNNSGDSMCCCLQRIRCTSTYITLDYREIKWKQQLSSSLLLSSVCWRRRLVRMRNKRLVADNSEHLPWWLLYLQSYLLSRNPPTVLVRSWQARRLGRPISGAASDRVPPIASVGRCGVSAVSPSCSGGDIERGRQSVALRHFLSV